MDILLIAEVVWCDGTTSVSHNVV